MRAALIVEAVSEVSMEVLAAFTEAAMLGAEEDGEAEYSCGRSGENHSMSELSGLG